MLLKTGINFISFLRSEVTDRTLDQFQICTDSLCPNPFNGRIIFQSIHFFIRPKIQINLVRFIQQLYRPVIPENFRKIAPDIRRKGQLSIRKCTGAGKSRRNRTWFTSDTLFCLAFRAISVFNGPALFNHQNFQI